MKAKLLLLPTLSLFFAFHLSANIPEGIKIGDSRSDVVSLLGTPSGCIDGRNKEILCYARGKVTLSSGIVTGVNLRSERQQVLFLERREVSRVNANLRKAELKEQRRTRELEMKKNQEYRDQITREAQALKESRLEEYQYTSNSKSRYGNFYRPNLSSHVAQGNRSRVRRNNYSGSPINPGYHKYNNIHNRLSTDFRSPLNSGGYKNNLNRCSPSGRTHTVSSRSDLYNRSGHNRIHVAAHQAKVERSSNRSVPRISHYTQGSRYCGNQINRNRIDHSRVHQAAHLAKLNALR